MIRIRSGRFGIVFHQSNSTFLLWAPFALFKPWLYHSSGTFHSLNHDRWQIGLGLLLSSLWMACSLFQIIKIWKIPNINKKQIFFNIRLILTKNLVKVLIKICLLYIFGASSAWGAVQKSPHFRGEWPPCANMDVMQAGPPPPDRRCRRPQFLMSNK